MIITDKDRKEITQLRSKIHNYISDNPGGVYAFSEAEVKLFFRYISSQVSAKPMFKALKDDAFQRVLRTGTYDIFSEDFKNQFKSADTFMYSVSFRHYKFKFQNRTDLGGNINYIMIGMLAKRYGITKYIPAMVSIHNIRQYSDGEGAYNLAQIENGIYWSYVGAANYSG